METDEPRAPTGEGDTLEEQKPRQTWPAFYATVWPLLQREARERGYCLALHGSLVRDMDVVAVPWVEDAVSAEALVAALCEATGAQLADHRCPVSKPHGRRAWSLYFEATSYVDLSVLPRQQADELARLRAEVARRDKALRDTHDHWTAAEAKQRERARAVESEVARLTAERDAAEARAVRLEKALRERAEHYEECRARYFHYEPAIDAKERDCGLSRVLTEGAGDNASTDERRKATLREILRTRTCPVHLLLEPCEICAAYTAGGL